MDVHILSKQLIELLAGQLGESEANSIVDIYFEDRFAIKQPYNGKDLDEHQYDLFLKDLIKFQKGEPVQYIVGKAYFYEHFFKVSPAVLIPRPETEELVSLALERISFRHMSKPSLLDIGTGTACIPISIKSKQAGVKCTALDVSPEALEIARENANKIGVEIDFLEIDFLNRSAWTKLGTYDFILSNPPYIGMEERSSMSKTVVDYEPDEALFVPKGNDPLVFYICILDFAAEHLSSSGEIIMEISEFRKEALLSYLQTVNGFEYSFLKDLEGKTRLLHLVRQTN